VTDAELLVPVVAVPLCAICPHELLALRRKRMLIASVVLKNNVLKN
jgi:hypothetical protein